MKLKYSDVDVIKMLEYLIDNILWMDGWMDILFIDAQP